MEVIFIEDCPANGHYAGDRAKVKAGFARNYLIPNKLAVEASSGSAKQHEHNQRLAEARKQKLKAEAEERAERFKDIKLEFKLNVGEKGKVFGAVTGKEIAEAINKAGQEVDRKQVKLSDSLRTIGTHTVEIKLHSEVFAEIEVEVLASKAAKSDKKAAKKKPAKKETETDETLEATSEEAAEEATEEAPAEEVEAAEESEAPAEEEAAAEEEEVKEDN